MVFRKSKNKKMNQDQLDEKQQDLLSSNLGQNLRVLRSLYKDCSDVVLKKRSRNENQKRTGISPALVFLCLL